MNHEFLLGCPGRGGGSASAESRKWAFAHDQTTLSDLFMTLRKLSVPPVFAGLRTRDNCLTQIFLLSGLPGRLIVPIVPLVRRTFHEEPGEVILGKGAPVIAKSVVDQSEILVAIKKLTGEVAFE